MVWEGVPVFLLQIKTGSQLGVVSAREAADRQMRRRLTDLVDACPLPKFHGVSAIGTMFCFYLVEDGHITPSKIVADNPFNTDTAPIGRWDCDVLEDEGAARLKAVVHEIHQACAQLEPGLIDSALDHHIFYQPNQ